MAKSIKKTITDALSNYKLIAVKKEVLSPDKFILHITFDGIIQLGKTMTLNQLADIMNKRFDQIEKRLDAHDAILQEHSKILREHSAILQEHSEILQEHSKILQEHSEIFKRNNLK